MGVAIDLSFEAYENINSLPDTASKGWLAADLSEKDWTVTLSAEAINEVSMMVDRMQENPLPMLLRQPAQFDIKELTKTYHRVKNICDNGVGFSVIDRLPLDNFEIEDMLSVYWILGSLMGPNVAQKWDGTMIYDVTDTGKKFEYGVRGSATNVELVFHTDNAFGIQVPDYVGLLCKHPAKSGGLSRFCSLYTVHTRMKEAFPKELQRLYEPMYFDRQAEHPKGKEKVSYAPMFTWREGHLYCRANSSLVRKGYSVIEHTIDASLSDALDAIDSVTSSADLWIEAPLERGQIQYLNNHQLGLYRSDFIDNEDSTKKRHLYRLWHRTSGQITYDG